jgi:hypothetical protein
VRGDNGLLTNARKLNPLLAVVVEPEEFPQETVPMHTAAITRMATTVFFNPPSAKS